MPPHQTQSSPRTDSTLEVELTTSSGHCVRGSVITIDRAMVRVEFDPDNPVALPMAQETELVFQDRCLAQPIRARARVISCNQSDDGMRYKFRLTQGLSRMLTQMFTTRAAFRVRIDSRRPIIVKVDGLNGRGVVRATMHSLSRHGLALLVNEEGEHVLFDVEKVNMTFTLPHDDAPFSLKGKVHYRELSGSAIRYGIEFDGLDCDGDGGDQSRLASFIAERQAEILRRSRELR